MTEIFVIAAQRVNENISVSCPEGWENDRKFCYLHVKEFQRWDDAAYYCKSFGGEIASIHDQQENDFIQSKFSS